MWLHALAGGLRGVGASMTMRAQEDRQMRGIALKEAFYSKRQQSQQEFQAGEAEKKRNFRAGESEKRRDFRAGESEAERNLRTDLHRESQAGAEGRHSESMAARSEQHKEAMSLRNKQLEVDAEQFTVNQKRLTKESEARASTYRKKLDQAVKSAELKSADNRREFLSTIYKAPNPDPSLGDKPVVDIHKVTLAENLYQKTGKFPWQTPVSAKRMMADVKAQGKSLDEVVQWLTDHKFDVRISEVERARKRMEAMESTETSGSPRTSRRPSSPATDRPDTTRGYRWGALP